MTDSLRVLEGSLVLGRYRVVKPLARGGMGMVYLGRVEGAAGFAKPVVIKRVLSQMDDGEASRAQFIREARILASLQHANIVGVMDFAQEGDSYLMILEYVHGYHLGHWLKYVRRKRGQVAWDQAVYVLLKVLAALHYAHTNLGPDGNTREIVHRDVSPGNVLIDLEGNVRLLDFGIAVEKDETDEFKTQDGVVKGKLPYIAPEMYRSSAASVSSDVYAAGVVLYQLLAGANPFSDRDMSSIVRRVLEVIPAPLSSLRDDLPSMLDEIVARAIAKKPEDRFSSAQEFSHALHAILDRSEGEIAATFRGTIRNDFTGDMASMLALEPLADLDAAWRTAVGNSEVDLLRSSLPPAADGDATAIVRAPHTEEALSEETIIEPRTGSGATSPPRGISSRALIVGMLGAAVLAAGVAVGAVMLTSPSKPEAKEPRFLLVERPGASPNPATSPTPNPTADTGDPLPPEDPTEDPQPVAPSEPATSPSPAPAVKTTTSSGGADGLTSAFAKKQGAIQTCFSANAESLEGNPQVSIRFQVSKAGQVTSASLQPGALAATALGSCILSVARGTRFPAQDKEVAFSIPIRAQTVQR